MIVCLWVTEVFPIWATSLLIPILVVWLDVYPSPTECLSPTAPAPMNGSIPFAPIASNGTDPASGCEPTIVSVNAANMVFGQFFSSSVMLALGAFTMSAALTKFELSDRLASLILSRVGTRPWLVLLVVMFLGLFLSMWISNVAAPMVILALVRPLLASLPEDEVFCKILLLGIAYSNNIGGMTTPIASPQNIVAIEAIEAHKAVVGWGPWLAVAMPYSISCTLAAFGFLWLFYRPKLAELPPIQQKQLKPFSWKHALVLAVCFATIALWAVQNFVETFTGNAGITALIPVAFFACIQFITKDDFKRLSWDVLMLLGGGIVLGSAIASSGLLHLIASKISHLVNGQNQWVILAAFSLLMWFFANFVSHTVAAIIISPVIAEVACESFGGCVAGRMVMLVVAAVLVDSGAMAFPLTSFPNAACYGETKSDGTSYLSTADFVKTGLAIGILEVILVLSVGFGLAIAVF